MSRLVRLGRHPNPATLATAIAAFLAEHDLSPGSQRVYAGALRSLQLGLGDDAPLAALDAPRAPERFAAWFPKALRPDLAGDACPSACHPALGVRLLAEAGLDHE